MCYNSVADIVVASQNRKIGRNSDKILPYQDVSRKPTWDFLLVTNSNFGRICYCFRDIDT